MYVVKKNKLVTILILVDGFLQLGNDTLVFNCSTVTILILVDGFLQYVYTTAKQTRKKSHNPYFSRWFSAISSTILSQPNLSMHNPYFSRWFSAIH